MGLSVYMLVAILKKQLGLDLSLHQIPQILSVTVFEKTLNSRGVFQLQRRDHRYRALHPVESIRLLMGQHWVQLIKQGHIEREDAELCAIHPARFAWIV